MEERERSCMTTLCYLEKNGCYLMLHRTAREHDVNRDKWIGVGGHFEKNESPEECLMREVKEETGYTLTDYRFRGLVTFCTETLCEYMCLYTADGFTGVPIECDEGTLEWVPKEKVLDLNIWEGDKIFFYLLREEVPFFTLKLVYREDILTEAVLNGAAMELFDERHEDGSKTGVVTEDCTEQRISGLRENQTPGRPKCWCKRGAVKKSLIRTAMIFPAPVICRPGTNSRAEPCGSWRRNWDSQWKKAGWNLWVGTGIVQRAAYMEDRISTRNWPESMS